MLRFASGIFLFKLTFFLSTFLTMTDLHLEKIMLIAVENGL